MKKQRQNSVNKVWNCQFKSRSDLRVSLPTRENEFADILDDEFDFEDDLSNGKASAVPPTPVPQPIIQPVIQPTPIYLPIDPLAQLQGSSSTSNNNSNGLNWIDRFREMEGHKLRDPFYRPPPQFYFGHGNYYCWRRC